MNDSHFPPPDQPQDPHHFQRPRDPKDLTTGAKVGLTFAGGGYSVITGFMVATVIGYNYTALGVVIGLVFLAVPVISLFIKGLRFFGLGAFLSIVFGCILPFAAILVICGRMGSGGY